MASAAERPRITEVQVRIDCNGCVQKIKKALNGINGIYEVYIDLPKQKLTIVGWADPEKIIKAIKKTRKTATIYSHSEALDPPPPEQPPPDVGAPPPEGDNRSGGPPPGESSQPPPPEPLKDQHPRPPPPLEPPRDQPPPPPQENPTAQGPPQPSGDANLPCHHQPKEVEEVHVIHHHPPDYGYGPRFGHGYNPGPPSYNPGPPSYNQPYSPGPYYSQGYGHDYSTRPSGYSQGYGNDYRPRPPPYSQGYGPYRDAPPGYSQQTGPSFGPEPPGYSQGAVPTYGPEAPGYSQGYGENWSGPPNTGYRPERSQPVQVTHSYSQYRPPPYVTHYEHVPSPSPPQYAPYARTDSYYYDESNRDYQSGSNGYVGSVFSEENPNACTIS